MRRIMQSIISSVLAFTMVFALPVAAKAATGIYSVTVSDKSVVILLDGKAKSTYLTTTANITLSSDKEKGLVASFTDSTGKKIDFPLGKQKTLSVSGTINTLTLSKSLDKDVTVTIPSGTAVTAMNVKNAGKVSVYGTISSLSITGASKITVAKGGSIASALVASSSAKLTAATGAKVTSVKAVSKSSVSGAGVGSVKIISKTQAAADASSTAAAQPSRTEGSKKDSAANQPGYVPTDDPSGGLGGGGSADAPLQETTPKGEGSKEGAMTGPMTNGGATGEVTQAERDQHTQANIDRKGAPWRGQSEPEKSYTVKRMLEIGDGGSWDSSIGGWVTARGHVVFPDGTLVGR